MLVYVVPDGLLAACALFSAIVLWGIRRRVPLAIRAFGVLFVLGVGLQSLLAGYQRMLVPLVPLLLLVTAFCVEHGRGGGPSVSIESRL